MGAGRLLLENCNMRPAPRRTGLTLFSEFLRPLLIGALTTLHLRYLFRNGLSLQEKQKVVVAARLGVGP
jgi:hypothetical protein